MDEQRGRCRERLAVEVLDAGLHLEGHGRGRLAVLCTRDPAYMAYFS
jgi:hypothetical protein